jgi:hypothetical protein
MVDEFKGNHDTTTLDTIRFRAFPPLLFPVAFSLSDGFPNPFRANGTDALSSSVLEAGHFPAPDIAALTRTLKRSKQYAKIQPGFGLGVCFEPSFSNNSFCKL